MLADLVVWVHAIHGAGDPIVPYDGGEIKYTRVAIVGEQASVDTFARGRLWPGSPRRDLR